MVRSRLKASRSRQCRHTFDIGIRVGTLQDSRLTAKRLCRNRRIVCAAPDYLRQHGTPAGPKDLRQHNCIVLRENEGDYALWRFGADNDETAIRVDGNLSSWPDPDRLIHGL